MKRCSTRICLLSLLTALLSCSGIYASDGNWDIEIALDKQDYLLHEPVVLDVTVTNNTSDTLRTHGLMQPNYPEFSVLLWGSDGEPMEYTGWVFSMASGPGELLLGAGEHDYNCFNILELYRSKESNSGYNVSSGILPRFPFLPKGTYTVVVKYEGELSNELKFNVVEPYGQEAEVLRIIERALHIWSKPDTDPSSRAYAEVPRDYPNSVYAEQCYYLSRFYSHECFNGFMTGGYDERTLDREMLAKYPDSYNVKGRMVILTIKKSEDEIIAIYDELIGENPDTRCSKIASLLKKRLLAKREAGE